MAKFRVCDSEGNPIKAISVNVFGKVIKFENGLVELSTAEADHLSSHYRVIGQSGVEKEAKGKK